MNKRGENFCNSRKWANLLAMPYINTLNIININCNTTDTQETDSTSNCNKNAAIHHSLTHEQHYRNMMQEPNRAAKFYANTDSISKSDNKDKPIDKEPNTINYFLPGPNQDNKKWGSVEITQQLEQHFTDVFTGIGCFDSTFLLQVKPDSKPYQVPLRCATDSLQKPFKEELEQLPTAIHHNTTRHGWVSRMVQQLCTSP